MQKSLSTLCIIAMFVLAACADDGISDEGPMYSTGADEVGTVNDEMSESGGDPPAPDDETAASDADGSTSTSFPDDFDDAGQTNCPDGSKSCDPANNDLDCPAYHLCMSGCCVRGPV